MGRDRSKYRGSWVGSRSLGAVWVLVMHNCAMLTNLFLLGVALMMRLWVLINRGGVILVRLRRVERRLVRVFVRIRFCLTWRMRRLLFVMVLFCGALAILSVRGT